MPCKNEWIAMYVLRYNTIDQQYATVPSCLANYIVLPVSPLRIICHLSNFMYLYFIYTSDSILFNYQDARSSKELTSNYLESKFPQRRLRIGNPLEAVVLPPFHRGRHRPF